MTALWTNPHNEPALPSRLVVDTASFSARLSANHGFFVHLQMVPGLPANPCLGWAAPCPRGACGESQMPFRSVSSQAAAGTGRPICRVSDWQPDRRPRTMCSKVCGCVPRLSRPSIPFGGGIYGRPELLAALQCGTVLRLPDNGDGLFPNRQRTSCHREKAAETLEAIAEMAGRCDRERPSDTIFSYTIYPWWVCASNGKARSKHSLLRGLCQ